MPKKIKIIAIFLLVVGVIAGLFYWFEIREYLAIRNCGKDNFQYIMNNKGKVKTYEDHKVILDLTEWKFFNCLNRKGIK